MHEELILGVDGGGSGSRAVLANLDGKILRVQTGPPCNYQNSNPQETKTALTELLRRLLQMCNLEKLSVRCAVFGLAGLDTPADGVILRNVASEALRESSVCATDVHVENDGIVTLKGLFGEGPGVLILSGTGSIAWGIAPGREPIRVGGWGHRLGDEGSGYAIGRAALACMFHHYDRQGGSTGMEPVLLATLCCQSLSDVAQWAYSPDYSVTKVARLAQDVLCLAGEGNETAKQIVETASESLADLFSGVADQLDTASHVEVALCGGILEHHRVVRNQLSQKIVARYPYAAVLDDRMPSALGATANALRLCGVDMTVITRRLKDEYKVHSNGTVAQSNLQ